MMSSAAKSRWAADCFVLAWAGLLGCGEEAPAEAWITACPAEGGAEMVSGEAPYLGSEGAPTSVVVFGDVTCPYTIRMMLALDAFAAKLDTAGRADDIEVQFRYLLKAGTEPVARAAEAAYLQGNGAFWQMFWCLATAGHLGDETVLDCASASGLDLDRFQDSLESEAVSAPIARDLALARDIGFTGIPGVLLCGVPFSPAPREVIANLEYLLSE